MRLHGAALLDSAAMGRDRITDNVHGQSKAIVNRARSDHAGPTVQFSAVHRFTAFLHLAGPPTPCWLGYVFAAIHVRRKVVKMTALLYRQVKLPSTQFARSFWPPAGPE